MIFDRIHSFNISKKYSVGFNKRDECSNKIKIFIKFKTLKKIYLKD